MELRNVCVYCGASDGVDPDYAAATEALGRLMADENVRLIYGGGAIGLMGILARAVLSEGGAVLGIIPQFLRDREVMLREATELVVTDDMHQRKQLMFEHSDAFVALPGGIGTLEETVEMMTWAQLGRHGKPVVLANIKGFWDPLVALLSHMDRQGFIRQPPADSPASSLFTVVDRVDGILPTLRRMLADAPALAESPAGLM